MRGSDAAGNEALRAHPFSAHERNAFFANEDSGSAFADLSALSGLDSEADSRSFALLDFDRDGDVDIAMANANAPSFNLFRTAVPQPGNFVAIRLSGGARPGKRESPPLSNRDAIGARITVTTKSGRHLTRVLSAGEGYGAQNSKTLIIGIGSEAGIRSFLVQWPSGRRHQSKDPVAAGSLIRVVETADLTRVETSPYLR